MPGARPTSPAGSLDPVRQARAYQDMLVGLVGSGDPAAIQAETPAMLRRLVVVAGADLRRWPEPREWSVLQCIAHLVDGELVSAGRIRWILAEDEPELPGYDQDRWVEHLHGPVDDPEALLTLFETLRRANLELRARIPPGAGAGELPADVPPPGRPRPLSRRPGPSRPDRGASGPLTPALPGGARGRVDRPLA